MESSEDWFDPPLVFFLLFLPLSLFSSVSFSEGSPVSEAQGKSQSHFKLADPSCRLANYRGITVSND